MIGQNLDLLLYKIAFALLMKLLSSMWKEKTTNQRGSSFTRSVPTVLCNDTSYILLSQQADAVLVRAIPGKRDMISGLLKEEVTRSRALKM